METRKTYCAVNNEGIDCPSYCCHYCPRLGADCGFPCSRKIPEECKELITKKQFFWLKVFGTMTEGVLTAL